MAKINLYLDVYDPAIHPSMASMPYHATETPQQKLKGTKRFKIVVDVPNTERLFAGKLDGVIPVEEVKEVDLDPE